MSGISGIWHLDGKPLSSQLVKSVSDTLQHRGPDGTAHWIAGPIGLSANLLRVTTESLSEIQPVVHPSGCVLVFDGRIDNRDELIVKLSPAEEPLSSSPDSFLALLAYLRFGKLFPAHITGDFALGLFDARNQELLLARDAIGVRPLYFYRDDRLFVFGSEIKAILAHPAVKTGPNESYLAVTMMGGTPPGDQKLTLFTNIFSVPPAHCLTVSKSNFSLARYWDFDLSTQLRYPSTEEYAEGFRHYFSQAVHRRLRSAFPVAITVSGGLDSSSIFCIAQKLWQSGDLSCPEVFGITYVSEPGSPADEIEFIHAIERMYKVEIHRQRLEYRPFLEGVHPSIRSFESPVGDIQWYNNSRLFELAKKGGARSLISGHWGDQIFFQQAYLVDLFRALRWKQLNSHLHEFSNWVDVAPKWFRLSFYRDLMKRHVPRNLRPIIGKIRARTQRPTMDQPWFTEHFRSLAVRSWSRYDPQRIRFASMHARGMYEEVRANYYVRAMEWNNKTAAAASLDAALPVLDRDLLWFLMRISGEVLTRNGVHRGLLREAMSGILPEEIRKRKTKADFTQMENATMERQYEEICGFFSGSKQIFSRGYVNQDALNAGLDFWRGNLRGAGCERVWSLADLVALEVWLQEFFAPQE